MRNSKHLLKGELVTDLEFGSRTMNRCFHPWFAAAVFWIAAGSSAWAFQKEELDAAMIQEYAAEMASVEDATIKIVGAEPPDSQMQAALDSVEAYMAMEAIVRTPSTILESISDLESAKFASDAGKPDESARDRQADSEATQETAQKSQLVKVAQLRAQIVCGYWDAAKDHLAALPKAGAPLVYTHVLGLLAESTMLRPEEILAIADAAPTKLSVPQCEQLGTLLSSTLTGDGKPQKLLAEMVDGNRRLGGVKPYARRNAARMLLAAGMLDEATTYVDYPDSADSETHFDLLDLCSQTEFARFQETPKPITLTKAWDFSVLAINAKPNGDPNDQSANESRRATIAGRLTKLLPQRTDQQQILWIRNLATSDPPQLMFILRALLRQAELAYASNDHVGREAVLKAGMAIGNTLSSDPDSDRWNRALYVLITPWTNEALKSDGESKRLISSPDDSEVDALEHVLLRQTAPNASWLDQLPTDTAAAVRRFKAKMYTHFDQQDEWLGTVTELASYDLKTAQVAIDGYIGSVTNGAASIMDEVDEVMRQYQGQGLSASTLSSYRQYYVQQMMNEENDEGGIALTRAAQVQSLVQMKEVLRSLANAKLPAPSDSAVAAAFVGAHSPAEVFRLSDVEAIFGPLTEIPIGTAHALGKDMRKRLAQQWRSLRIQEYAGTQRSEIELSRELIQGYELAIRMIETTLSKDASNVDLHLLLGLLLFDQSEYLYGLGSDLPTYIKLRDRSFAEIREAASCYADALPDSPADPSIEVHLRWFQVALGASDLTYLTRQSTADEPQIRKLAAAIQSLGDPMAEKHLTLFGKALESEFENVPPALKQRSLSQALIVLGEHSAGDETRRLSEYYQQLLAEVELHSEVDGSQRIGAGQPFGLRLSIRYSTPMGREGNHFIGLLQKSDDEVDHREKLEEEIREKLSENFQINEIRFHQPTVKPQPYQREGWLQTPLAYLVLSAKDPAVDTIAPLQIDVQFRDGRGSVLLPITSSKLLVDAKSKTPPPRPYSDLTVTQLLDARQVHEGKLQLEINASGKGLMPELSQIASLAKDSVVSGFRVVSVADHGAAITELETSKRTVRPLSERVWIASMELVKQQETAIVDQFTFPKILANDAKILYEQYSDADIEQVPSRVALAPQSTYDSTRAVAYAGFISLAALALLIFGWWLWRRRCAQPERKTYSVPEQLTPFSLVAFLRRICNDKQLSFSAADMEDLTSTIHELEERYFSNPTAGDRRVEDYNDDLRELFKQWNAKTQQQFRAKQLA